MAASVNIDFDKLDQDIISLKNLLKDLDEPSYDKVDFWLSGITGSGMVRDYLVDFCNCTIDFHRQIVSLINHTVAYLESVKKLKDADQSIADSL